jgi:MFS family permease
VGRRVRAAWGLPGTRLGFWTHFTAMSTTTALGVLWGLPYLVGAAGFSTAAAGGVLMAGVIAAAVCAPIIGLVTGRRPAVRVPLAVAISALTVVGLLVLVTAFGDTPPHAYVIALFVFAAVGGPAAMVAFALARDYNATSTLGTASGVVNVGGFVATVVIALGIGWAIGLQGGSSPHSLRLALLVAVAVQSMGIVRTAVWWLRVRARALDRQSHGEYVPVAVVRRPWDLSGDPTAGTVTEPRSESGTMAR